MLHILGAVAEFEQELIKGLSSIAQRETMFENGRELTASPYDKCQVLDETWFAPTLALSRCVKVQHEQLNHQFRGAVW
jgi:hypothetical protein